MGLGYLPVNKTTQQSQPISTFVVKVASGCNLGCKYCYMYEHPDQLWREQPKFISEEIIDLLGFRIREYVKERDLKRLLIPVHGGEPTLLGADRLRDFFARIVQKTSDLSTEIKFGMQTNGTLIDDEIVTVLQEFDVYAGVSIDGPKKWNDLGRLDKKGKSSYFTTMRGVDKLRNPASGKPVFGGFLTVANPDISPKEFLEFFESLNAPAVDFLLPDFNHDTYPTDQYPPGTFGSWMCDLYDRWLSSNSRIEIRFFNSVMKLLLGGKYGFDSVGSLSYGVVVIETDGTYHALDVLKTAYHGATVTGKSLRTSPISELEDLPLVRALSNKAECAAQKCLECNIFSVCGGGYLPHRYSSTRGFNSESVFCTDLIQLINHINLRLIKELAFLY